MIAEILFGFGVLSTVVLSTFENSIQLLLDKAEINKMFVAADLKSIVDDVYKTDYGFKANIVLDPNENIFDIKKKVILFEHLFEANIIIEPTKNKQILTFKAISDIEKMEFKELLRYKWSNIFENKRNDRGQTYLIEGITDIVDQDENIVGYNLTVVIPTGLTYADLQASKDILEKQLGLIDIEWNRNAMKANVEVITVPFNNKVRYKPIVTKPYQLYVGMRYNYQPIILDFKKAPNWLNGGGVNTGKTMALITAATNLAYQFKDEVNFYVGALTDKPDLSILENLAQTKMYEDDLQGCLNIMLELERISKDRNSLFKETGVVNIFEYNQKSKEKLPYIYFLTDEIADFMPNEDDKKQGNEYKKSKFETLFWEVARKYRSCGIYICASTQRGSLNNLNSEIKAHLINKTCFYQTNTASALTIFGNGEGYSKLITEMEKQREFLVDYSEGVKKAKTLYLDKSMIKNLLKDCFVKKDKQVKKEIATSKANGKGRTRIK